MILTNAKIATMLQGAPYGLIDDGCVVIDEGRVAWVGPTGDVPGAFDHDERLALEGRLITPGLVDCHTHIVHGGHRATEFEQRLNGVSYAEIAAAGGGILSTVTATRAASVDALLQSALPRIDALLAEGVTTLEVKSGYGLTPDAELAMLRAARAIARVRPIRIKTTYLAAHAVPPEYTGRAEAYVAEVCLPTLEQAAAEGLVDAVDGFCETIAFSTDQLAPLFDHAKALGLPVKLHAEQLSHQGGTLFAAKRGALSADHIEYATEADAAAMARAGTVAVILPGAFYTLSEVQRPPIAALRSRGVPIALATDCNPGSSPLTSLLLTMNMGCTLFGLTPEEALRGTTGNAAKALGISDAGVIQAGAHADLCVWDVEDPSELAYRIGFNPLHKRMFGGVFR
ncbi:MAG: imidazolonepropionase [Pseudomonadota bacterium]